MELNTTIFSWIPLILMLILPLIPLLRRRNRNKKAIRKPKHPPGPPKIPILGNCVPNCKLPHQLLWQLSKTYGPIMLLQLGHIPTLVISSAEMAKEILKTHDLDFCSRPLLVGPGKLSYNFIDVVFGPYTKYWREIRKICVLELLSMKRVQSFKSVRVEEVSLMINSISKCSDSRGAPVNLTEEILSLTFHIISSVAFGRSHIQGRDKLDSTKFQYAIYETMTTLGSFFAADLFPFGRFIDVLTGQQARLEKNFRELDEFFQQVIDEHLDPERPASKHEDFVDVLLGLAERNPYGSVCLTKDHIKALLMNIFLGGTDTSTLTMVWTMAELVKNPRIMKKVQEEIRNHVGIKGKVDESDLDDLQYLKMVMKETLRLHPPGPILIPRECINYCNINGYDIYPKTMVFVNAWAIGRDPKSWLNPEEFCPERFADSSIDFRGKNFELIPFGAGRRGCPGISMGTALMELTLANLLYSFNWELPSGMKKEDLDMEEEGKFVVHKKSGLHLVPKKYAWES